MMMKTTIQMKLSPDIYIQQSFEHIVGNEDEAKEAGKESMKLQAAFNEGWAEAGESM